MKTNLMIGAVIALMGLAACDDRPAVVNAFYGKHTTLDAQKAAIKTHSAKEKWRILAYGAARGDDHAIMLAPVIAEDGKSVIDAMEADLSRGSPDMHYLTANLLLVAIREGKHYDVCGDSALRARLEGYAEKIGDQHMMYNYQGSLHYLCAPDQGERASAPASSAVGQAVP